MVRNAEKQVSVFASMASVNPEDAIMYWIPVSLWVSKLKTLIWDSVSNDQFDSLCGKTLQTIWIQSLHPPGYNITRRDLAIIVHCFKKAI